MTFSVEQWCERRLGAAVVERLSSRKGMSTSVGVLLDDGRHVMVKARADEQGRAARCVTLQNTVADTGFLCPRPLTGVEVIDGVAVHAEEWLPGGVVPTAADTAMAGASARHFAALMSVTVPLAGPNPGPNPDWVNWYRADDRLWAPNAWFDTHCGDIVLPEPLQTLATRCRARLLDHDLPFVIGYADWEAQNLRTTDLTGNDLFVVHDWDSLAWLPEAGHLGVAGGGFASQMDAPTLVPVSSTEAFFKTYQELRRRQLSRREVELAWAASLWVGIHNARAELLSPGRDQIAWRAVQAQGEERLRRAGA